MTAAWQSRTRSSLWSGSLLTPRPTVASSSINNERRCGKFRLANGILPDSCRLYADSPGATWLNPCKWDTSAPVISFSTNQPSVSTAVVAPRGAVMPIVIQDHGQLLSKNIGVTAGADLLIGVGDDSVRFEPASLISRTPSASNYQVIIPLQQEREHHGGKCALPFDESVWQSLASSEFDGDSNHRVFRTIGGDGNPDRNWN